LRRARQNKARTKRSVQPQCNKQRRSRTKHGCCRRSAPDSARLAAHALMLANVRVRREQLHGLAATHGAREHTLA
jgi:hypothetical protein